MTLCMPPCRSRVGESLLRDERELQLLPGETWCCGAFVIDEGVVSAVCAPR